MNGVVISLCDLTGNFVAPWVEAGFDAVLVDPQHGETHEVRTGPAVITKLAETVEGAANFLTVLMREREVVFVAGFPPCTDLANSGARWWSEKRRADYMFQARAVSVAEQCRTIGRLSGAPWFVENPAGALSRVFGPASHTFNPCDYTGWEESDNYTKLTCLWTGGGFVMPPPRRSPELGEPDNRIHFAPPGPERANFRSATPMGFARAVFDANCPDVDAEVA